MVEVNVKNPAEDYSSENDNFQELLRETENKIQKIRTTCEENTQSESVHGAKQSTVPLCEVFQKLRRLVPQH